jgi:hypothetical protein
MDEAKIIAPNRCVPFSKLPLQTKTHDVVLMIDVNESFDAIRLDLLPNTHLNGSRCIDFLYVSQNLLPFVRTISILHFSEGCHSGHLIAPYYMTMTPSCPPVNSHKWSQTVQTIRQDSFETRHWPSSPKQVRQIDRNNQSRWSIVSDQLMQITYLPHPEVTGYSHAEFSFDHRKLSFWMSHPSTTRCCHPEAA